MSTASKPPLKPGLTVRSFFHALLRIVLILLLVVIISGGLYVAVPMAYRDLVLPVQQNTARLNILETSVPAERALLLARLDDLQARLNQLETARVSSGSDLAAVQGDIDALRRDVDASALALKKLDTIESELNSFSSMGSYNATQVMDLKNNLQAPGGDLNSLRREVARLKALNLLTRAQVHLDQNNFGMAREDALLARAVLLDLRSTSPDTDLAQIDEWIARLNLALGNLPNFPVVAAGDLEQAYQLLAGAMLPTLEMQIQLITPTPTSTSTPATWLTETSAALTGTPTPLGLSSSTPTPYSTPIATKTAMKTATKKP
jgi:hypothetical protein